MKTSTPATSISNMFRSRRTHITAFLVSLGLLALCYNIFTAFPSLSSSLKTTLQHTLPKNSYCTKGIGEGICCDLFLAAEPCVETCREKHLDRETFVLTEEFELCHEQCLVPYTKQCTHNDAKGNAAKATTP